MDVHRELNHVVSRNSLTLVLWVRLTSIWQVERCIQLLRSHRRVGWIYHHVTPVNTLQQSLCVHHVRLLLNILEVLSLSLLVLHALLVRVQHYVVFVYTPWYFLFASQINRLRQIANIANLLAVAQSTCQFNGGLLAHAVGNHISRRVAQQALLQAVAPVVVMRHSSQRSLDASQHYGHIRIKLLKNLGIHYRWVLWSHVVTSVRTVCIL